MSRCCIARQERCGSAPSVINELVRFETHLAERGLNQKYIRDYSLHARRFADYIQRQGIDVERVESREVESYFRVALRLYRREKPGFPKSLPCWRKMSRRSVQSFLRFVQGEWPPASGPAPLLEDFRAQLKEVRYSKVRMPSIISVARQFLAYLRQRGIPVGDARPCDLEGFLESKLRKYRKRHGCLPKVMRAWRSQYRSPIYRLMRMVQPQWPPPKQPANDLERFHYEISESYGRWLTEVLGLSQGTLTKNGDAARLFLRWLGHRGDRKSLCRLTVADIDAYLEWRMPGLRRATRYGVCNCLRSFLRYLHVTRSIPRDLSSAVSGPILYELDEVPRAFTEQQVAKVLEVTRRDRTVTGQRDYAILTLFATYGLRLSEVARLRLEDIDWRGEQLRVHQSKTGTESLLPLVPPVGEALLEYLRHGRPETDVREVFLRAFAPYGPFQRAGSIDTMISSRLKRAGIEVNGRHGAHAFRFARAASLLDASVPLKSIGDLLGHQSASSTAVYLRLPTDNLRAISLELP